MAPPTISTEHQGRRREQTRQREKLLPRTATPAQRRDEREKEQREERQDDAEDEERDDEAVRDPDHERDDTQAEDE